jgi:hypothetical protein
LIFKAGRLLGAAGLLAGVSDTSAIPAVLDSIFNNGWIMTPLEQMVAQSQSAAVKSEARRKKLSTTRLMTIS